MRLTITDVNFTSKYDWLFKLIDQSNEIYYIMDDRFYRNHKVKSPITKQHLDYLDVGQSISAITKEINGKKIVIELAV